MEFIIPEHPDGALSLPGSSGRAQASERQARLAALDPEQLPMALTFLSGYHPSVFDAILNAVEPCAAADAGDDGPAQEPFCVLCGAPVAIFLAHGKDYRHYRGALTSTSKPKPFKTDHTPVIAWRTSLDISAQ